VSALVLSFNTFSLAAELTATGSRLSQAMEELQTWSLVKKDRETGTLSIHRLIQTHFQEFLGPAGREKTHRRFSKLVFLAFPERAPQLKEHWERCSI
jgi:DNA-binding transcriptional regulator GbsR (MarR family)